MDQNLRVITPSDEESEILEALKNTDNYSGYLGVYLDKRGKSKRYRAQVWRGGKMVSLGTFATAEEAALCIAQSPEGRATAARGVRRAAARGVAAREEAPPLTSEEASPLTSEEARQQAEIEGLTLVRNNNMSGYYGVSLTYPNTTKPYQARVMRSGKRVSLGFFATPEEAALIVARTPEGKRAAEKQMNGPNTSIHLAEATTRTDQPVATKRPRTVVITNPVELSDARFRELVAGGMEVARATAPEDDAMLRILAARAAASAGAETVSRVTPASEALRRGDIPYVDMYRTDLAKRVAAKALKKNLAERVAAEVRAEASRAEASRAEASRAEASRAEASRAEVANLLANMNNMNNMSDMGNTIYYSNGGKKRTNRKIQKTKSNKYKKHTKKHTKKHNKNRKLKKN